MVRGRYLIFSLCLTLAFSASLLFAKDDTSFAPASDSSNIVVALPDELGGEVPETSKPLYIEEHQPRLSSLECLQLLFHQFPHLQTASQPTSELTQRDTASDPLNVYEFSWEDRKLIVELNADTGEILQYADIDALLDVSNKEESRQITQSAAKMLAIARFQRVLSPQEQSFFPEDPEAILSDSGVHIFYWIRHYHGIPYYGEQMVVAIHPLSGMTLAVLNLRDFTLGETALPKSYLSHDEAYALVRSHIDPVLIDLDIEPDQEPVQVWLSGISYKTFDASGKSFETISKKAGVQLKEGQVLLIDKETARQRFNDTLKLNLQWIAPEEGEISSDGQRQLKLVYVISFRPLKESRVTVIPATIGEAEFLSATKGKK